MPLMVLIETVSRLIRPLTLFIRLIANMIAGHLVLSLVGGAMSTAITFVRFVPAQLALLGLELAVAIIQAYVFIILVSLYVKEAFVRLN